MNFNKRIIDEQSIAKSAIAKLFMAVALATGLLITQGNAIAGDRGKDKQHRHDHVSQRDSQKHRSDRQHASPDIHRRTASFLSSKAHKHTHGYWKRGKGHHKHGYRHGKHRHHARHHGHRNHDHHHAHSYEIIRPYVRRHYHGHHDPRISLGLHLGHFDLYFED